jgi:hypothetical protein
MANPKTTSSREPRVAERRTSSVKNSTINDNVASAPGGRANGGGMGILNASVTVANTRFSSNIASAPGGTALGGGIRNRNGTAHLSDSAITDNTASGSTAQGGGLFNTSSGQANLSNSAVTDNTASGTSSAAGGGIFNANATSGSVTLNDSRVSANKPNNCTPSIGT